MIISGDGIVAEDKKPKKYSKLIISLIIILSIICIAIIGLVVYLQATTRKITIDGASISPPSDLFIIDEVTGDIQISIQDFARYVNYEFYSGDYYPKVEDNTKCYVQGYDEVAVYSLNSNTIYKTPLLAQPEYENFTITQPVKVINNKLYTTPEGIRLGFNVTFEYNVENNSIQIYTLPYLAKYYTSVAINMGYAGISADFKNQKALLYNMIVVSNLSSSSTKEDDFKYGVISTDGNNIIGTKYDNISFVETTKEFFVTSLNKVGIVTNTGATKVSPLFDSLKLLDKNLNLYLAKSTNKYGVLDNAGNILIHLEYTNIGIDASLYPTSNIKNPLFLFDNCIPVEQNGKCGIFNKEGQLIVPMYYDGFGYVQGTSTNINANNIIIIPEYEAIVVYKQEEERAKTNKYGLVNSLGTLLVPCEFDKIYSITSAGKEEYYLEKDGQTVKVQDYLRTNTNTNTNVDPQDQTNTIDNTANNIIENNADNNLPQENQQQQQQEQQPQDQQPQEQQPSGNGDAQATNPTEQLQPEIQYEGPSSVVVE